MKKVTVDLGDGVLYRELKVKAAELDRPVRDVIIDALRQWLQSQQTSRHDSGR